MRFRQCSGTAAGRADSGGRVCVRETLPYLRSHAALLGRLTTSGSTGTFRESLIQRRTIYIKNRFGARRTAILQKVVPVA